MHRHSLENIRVIAYRPVKNLPKSHRKSYQSNNVHCAVHVALLGLSLTPHVENISNDRTHGHTCTPVIQTYMTQTGAKLKSLI